ncbi:MAG: tRNA (adenosine(37)-N6)-threonylcarbamoyltransferase complex ATPase subunit type 1 TsaE [Akkermansia sp.]
MPGEVLGVVGELGAGKTHLTQGIMEGLGSSDAAASPTFSLVHEHADGRLRACHFDFYRLKDESELLRHRLGRVSGRGRGAHCGMGQPVSGRAAGGNFLAAAGARGECLRRVSLAPVE